MGIIDRSELGLPDRSLPVSNLVHVPIARFNLTSRITRIENLGPTRVHQSPNTMHFGQQDAPPGPQKNQQLSKPFAASGTGGQGSNALSSTNLLKQLDACESDHLGFGSGALPRKVNPDFHRISTVQRPKQVRQHLQTENPGRPTSAGINGVT